MGDTGRRGRDGLHRLPASLASAEAPSTGSVISGSLCSVANWTTRSCSNPCGWPSGPMCQPAGPERTATTSWSCGSSTAGAGGWQRPAPGGGRVRFRAPTSARRATRAEKRSQSSAFRRRCAQSRTIMCSGLRTARGACRIIVAATASPACQRSRSRLYCRSRVDSTAHRVRSAPDQRRVAPHCMVVNLVRSGRKQPQRTSASAGGTARHLSADEKRVRCVLRRFATTARARFSSE